MKDARRIVGPDALIGVSTHSIEQVRQAILDAADYLGVGPTFFRKPSFECFRGWCSSGRQRRKLRCRCSPWAASGQRTSARLSRPAGSESPSVPASQRRTIPNRSPGFFGPRWRGSPPPCERIVPRSPPPAFRPHPSHIAGSPRNKRRGVASLSISKGLVKWGGTGSPVASRTSDAAAGVGGDPDPRTESWNGRSREVLRRFRDRGFAVGHFRGLLHIAIGRRITPTARCFHRRDLARTRRRAQGTPLRSRSGPRI